MPFPRIFFALPLYFIFFGLGFVLFRREISQELFSSSRGRLRIPSRRSSASPLLLLLRRGVRSPETNPYPSELVRPYGSARRASALPVGCQVVDARKFDEDYIVNY